MRGTASSRLVQIVAATSAVVLLAVAAMWLSEGGSDRASSSSTSTGRSTTTSRPQGGSGPSTTTRPNLTPGDTTAVPVLTEGPVSLHLDAPMLTMGQQVTSSYTTNGATSGSTATIDGFTLPFFVGYRSDTAWLTVQSSFVADLPFLAVPDAIAMQSGGTTRDPIDWAKGDDGVDSAQVLQSNDLELIIRAKGLSDADFVGAVSSLRAAPHPIFVADLQGVLQRLHLSTVVTLEGPDAIDALTFGTVQGGTVYGTTAGPVVVRASSPTSTDLRYLDLVAAGEVRRSTEGYYSGTLRSTHDDFIAWVEGDTRFTITAPHGGYNLEALARGAQMSEVPTEKLSSLPLSTFDDVPSSVSFTGSADGYWGFDLDVGTYGRRSGRLITCFKPAVPPPNQSTTTVPGAPCAGGAFTFLDTVDVPHRIAVPGATLVVAAVNLDNPAAGTATLTASSSHDKARTVALRQSLAGTFGVGLLTMSPGVPITMSLGH